MKFTKLIALLTALVMLLAFTVACDNGDGGAETTAGGGDGSDESTAPAFVTTITVIALDEEGEEVVLIDEEEAEYSGEVAHDSLTIFEIVADYCYFSDIAYTLDEDTGRFVSIGEYSIEDGGVMWTYKVDGEALTDYDIFLTNGAEIVITMVEK